MALCFVNFPQRRLRYDDVCAATKVLLDAGLPPLTPGKSESESPEGGKHQTVLIESGRREEDAGSEEAGKVRLPHSRGIIWDQVFKTTGVRPG